MSEIHKFSMSDKMKQMYREEYESTAFRESMINLIKRLEQGKYIPKDKMQDVIVQYVMQMETLMQKVMKLAILTHTTWVTMVEEENKIRKEIDDELKAMEVAQKTSEEDS